MDRPGQAQKGNRDMEVEIECPFCESEFFFEYEDGMFCMDECIFCPECDEAIPIEYFY